MKAMGIGLGMNFGGSQTVLQKLRSYSGLTFYKNYQGATTLDADYSVGSPTATFTASRSASNPATYIDANGVVQLVTSANVGRYNSKLYDTTGLLTSKRGVIIEAAGTNLLTRTDGTAASGGLWTGWFESSDATGSRTLTNNAIPELTSISGATSQRIQYTGVVGDSPDKGVWIYPLSSAVDSVAQNDVLTFSVYIRSTTGNSGVAVKLYIQEYTSADGFLANHISSGIENNLSTSWRKFTFTATITNATASRSKCFALTNGIGNTDLVDIEFALPQLEKNPYATTYIPTTTAALTRPAEVLKYETAGNRTAAAETIFYKFIPFKNYSADGVANGHSDTDTARRLIYGGGTGYIGIYADVDSTTIVNSTTSPTKNTSCIFAAVLQGTGNPNTEVYINGVSEGTSNTDFPGSSLGTYFYLGYSTNGKYLEGILQSFTTFNRALTATEVAAVTTLLQNSN